MAIDKLKIKVLNRLFEAGICEEKAISSIGLKEVVELRMSSDENAALFELQNAVKKNKVIGYLAGEQDEPKKEQFEQKQEEPVNNYMGY